MNTRYLSHIETAFIVAMLNFRGARKLLRVCNDPRSIGSLTRFIRSRCYVCCGKFRPGRKAQSRWEDGIRPYHGWEFSGDHPRAEGTQPENFVAPQSSLYTHVASSWTPRRTWRL